MPGEIDKLERGVDSLRTEVNTMGRLFAVAIANMEQQAAVAKETKQAVERVNDKIDQQKTDLGEHETEDAGQFATLRAEVSRLWWGIGIVMGGVVSTLIAVLRGE